MIGKMAFMSCTALTSVNIPKSVTLIAEEAWKGVCNDKSIFEAGNTVHECEIITDFCNDVNAGGGLVLPDEITEIGKDAFKNCWRLKSITIPASVKTIGYAAFRGSGLVSINFADNSLLGEIGIMAFMYCFSLKSITIPASVTKIGQEAFHESGLNCIEFEDNSLLREIGAEAFRHCKGLISIIIPASVEMIGYEAFRGSGLEFLNFKDNSKGRSLLREIGTLAFYNCSGLNSITIPASVEIIGPGAFDQNSGLESINFKDNSQLVEIGNSAFRRCEELKMISIPENVQKIGIRAFEACASLKTVSIPPGMEVIGDKAFMSCTALTSVNIPKSVTSIGENAWKGVCKDKSIFEAGNTVHDCKILGNRM